MTIISGTTIVVLLSVPTLLYSAASMVTGRVSRNPHSLRNIIWNQFVISNTNNV